MSFAKVFLSYPSSVRAEAPAPRRSGAITVWDVASTEINGVHMWLVWV